MRCNFCEWRCELANGKLGICGMYQEEKGSIKERFPNKWCTYGISHIESLPFYHVYPGSRSMTIGTAGCNFDCQYCVNAYIAKENPLKLQDSMYEFTPAELVGMAKKLGCHNIVFNVNEPTMSLPSLLELAKVAEQAEIPMGCLTNAYMTEEATELMVEIFSFFNVSLKGLSTDFSRKYLGVPDLQPVLRNIKKIAQESHLEITTPIIETVNDGEIDQLTDFISSIDREIPWHVFRLQPEYKMKEVHYPNIELIKATLVKKSQFLAYIYFHNFIGSDWVNTLCPRCGMEVIERISLGCGGDIMKDYHCQDSGCPKCGYAIRLLGEKVAWNARGGRLMSIAIVDVREWQNIMDLRTGKKIKADTPAVRMIKNVLAKNPYPGDLDLGSNQWVTDTALELIDKYNPQFAFLSYAQQYFSTRFTFFSEAERKKMYQAVFAEIERFTQESGFLPVVVGTGDMIPVAGRIDLSRLDGLAVSSNWATRYAGLYQMSKADLDYLGKIPEIERIISKEEFITIFGGKAEDGKRLPDYLAITREGFHFKAPYLRHPVMIPAQNNFIPVSTALGEITCLTAIREQILTYLESKKIALILVEGIGVRDFLLPYNLCANGVGWYYYEPGEAQYLAISQGKQQLFTYPPGYRYYLEKDEKKEYPFSGYFTTIPEDTIGSSFRGRSIAVGNRSMFMHTTTGTDIAYECFARNLNNQGCLAVIHREDK